NEELERRVEERTEELQTANENLLHEMGERLNAEQETQSRAHNTFILNEIIHVLNEAPDLPTLYERALTTILEQLKLESGLIATVSDTGRLTVEYTYNHPSEFIKAINGLNVDDNSFTRSLYQRQEVVAWDITPPDTTSFRLALKGSAIGIPFLSEGKVVGHVSFHAADRRTFTADERALFRTIGLEFGTAIAKLRAKARVDEYSRQQTILNLVIAEGNRASDLTAALQAMLDTAMQIADVDYGAVYLLNEAEGLVELQHARGFSQEVLDATRRLPVTTPHYSDVYKGTPVFLDDFAKEGSEQFRALVPELHTTVLIPLGAENHVIGHFGLGSSKIRGFTADERALLVAAGFQVGSVVARLQAEEATKVHAQHAETLSQIISAGNRATSLQAALIAMVDSAMELLNLDLGAIFLRDGDAMALQHARGYTDEQRAWSERVPISQRRVARIMDGAPWISEDYKAEATPDVRGMNKDLGSMATVPLIAGETIVGFCQFSSLKRSRHFTKEERDLLVAIGQEAGAVVARLQAEDAAKAHALRTAVLNEIIHLLNEAPDLPTLYDQALAITVDRLGFDFAVIATEEASGHLCVQHAYNLSPEVVQALNHTLIDEYPYTRTVYREGELIVYDEAPLDTLIARSGTRGASVAIPFYSEGKVVGHIALMAERPRSFTAEDRQLFTAIGEEFGTAMARLATKQHADQRATMLEGARDAIVMWDVNDLITYWNHGAERLYGWAREEALGKHIHSLLNTTFAEPLERIKSTLIEAGRWEGELTHTTRTGTTVTVESHMTLERAPDGTPIATLEINNDVTEQQQAEEQVRAAARYTRSLIEVSLDPLVTINAEGVITDVNTATEEVTGYSRDELIGSDFSDYFTEPKKARAGYKQVFTDSLVRDYPLAIRHKSGRVTDVLYNASVYRDEAGEVLGVFAAARDVTERKRAEEELQRYSDHLEALVEERTGQLKDAERLAGIGETAAMIGHDLRNPLQGLQYIVDLQKLRFEHMPSERRDTDDWGKEQALFDRISEQIYYMDKIVADLQDYARELNPEREALSVRTLIDDVLQSLPHANGTVNVHVDLPDLTIWAEPHLMHRVFSNLILNATQAMPDGGTLTIDAKAADGSVAICVSDTGVGIPAAMRAKIFSPLVTGKAKGTGLGLAVVKRIVEAHDGTVEFESEEGSGTTFTVTLPLTSGG
ncbi:MAG: GAF domain-containing protein, partial [Halobacteriota archaeon]